MRTDDPPQSIQQIRRMLGRLLGRELDGSPVVPRGVIVRANRLITGLGGRLAGHGKAAAAVTFGRTIIVHPDVRLTERLLRHELAHVQQWQRAPFTFPLRYAWQHVRRGYRDNPYEVEARAAEHGPGGPPEKV